jgi:branched-chain amino acid transport system substrate-binding protein
MKNLLAVGLAALTAGLCQPAVADPVKIGFITTLSGSGSGIGTEVRDGFLLGIKLAGNDEIEVLIEDDAMRPDVAVQIADKMIQSDEVDILTGILWSNLVLAVAPGAVAQDKFYLSPNAGGSPRERGRLQEGLFAGAELSGRRGHDERLQALLQGRAGRRVVQ